MKKLVVLVLVLCVYIVNIKCNSQKKIHYIVPEQYTGETRQNLINMLEHGQRLYKINCSRCHGIYGKGKDSIPNFSQTQIENYEKEVIMADPDNHAVMQKVRPYDLDMIFQFLQFRKTPKTPTSNH